MKLYNTSTGKKEDFTPIEPGKVKLYVCGPTVYDFIHVGNARPIILFDVLRRYFEFRGYDVTFVQNFTDVDDKIIDRANKEGVDSLEISERFIEEYFTDARGLGVKPATHHPKVTEHIDGIVTAVQTLIDKGFAYELNGDVYYRTGAFPQYGKLSGQNLEELQAGARVDVQVEKESPLDFALWKSAKPGEPAWESPWGPGRPGWHIECSAMAKKYLGDTIDIHAGGEDLIFPHHENEIAQSVCANGAPFAKYWLHNGFITIDSKKMSKSEGNFFTLREISDKYPYEAIRFFILNGHYRMPMNFSEELIMAAENGLTRIKNCHRNLDYLEQRTKDREQGEKDARLVREAEAFRDDFIKVMDDDFNTADAVTAIYELVRFLNVNLNEDSALGVVKASKAVLAGLCDVLGISPDADDNALDKELPPNIAALLEKRKEARLSKEWAESDRLRDELLALGVAVEDKREGQVWSYK